MDAVTSIKQTIADNPVVIFMKGTPEFPQCGFSMRTVQVLKACGADFAYVDVLANPDVRAQLPQVSNWPTFPQLFINGELIGGCDITLDLFQRGELKAMLQATAPKTG